MKKKSAYSKVLVFGDMHLSDTHRGRYKDYVGVCKAAMNTVEGIVKKEKPDAVCFAGDMIGVGNANIRSHEFLGEVLSFFKKLGKSADVWGLKGNHDISEYSDFDLMRDLNIIKTTADCDYIDIDGDFSKRLHLTDYGSEKRDYSLKEGSENIVIAHNYFMIQGLSWNLYGKGYDTAGMTNLQGITSILSGHIHLPSTSVDKTTLVCGGDVKLAYLGCMTRPSGEDTDFVWYGVVTGLSEGICLEPIQLGRVSDLLEDKPTVDELENKGRREDLRESLECILNARYEGADLHDKIKAFANADDRVKALALKYLDMALESKQLQKI